MGRLNEDIVNTGDGTGGGVYNPETESFQASMARILREQEEQERWQAGLDDARLNDPDKFNAGLRDKLEEGGNPVNDRLGELIDEYGIGTTVNEDGTTSTPGDGTGGGQYDPNSPGFKDSIARIMGDNQFSSGGGTQGVNPGYESNFQRQQTTGDMSNRELYDTQFSNLLGQQNDFMNQQEQAQAIRMEQQAKANRIASGEEQAEARPEGRGQGLQGDEGRPDPPE
jgi:hypothetical protein